MSSLPHELTTEECTVDHSHWKGIDGDDGEPCRTCKHCKRPIRPVFANERCAKRNGCDHTVQVVAGVLKYSKDLTCAGECSEGCCDYFQCIVCGDKFKVEHS